MRDSAIKFNFTIAAPHRVNNTEAAQMREAVAENVTTLQQMVDRFAPEELKRIAAQARAAMNEEGSTDNDEQNELITFLNEGHQYSAAERVALEQETLARSFERRKELLAGALTVPEVAKLLGTSRQTPHDRLRNGSLLAVLDRGAWRFPLWQFDAEGPDGVVPGLPDVLRSLHVSPLAKVSWLTRPHSSLRGQTPLRALKNGHTKRVLMAAQSVGVF